MSSRPLQLRRRSKRSLGARARSYWIPVSIACAAFVALGWALATAPMFRPSSVTVTGAQRVTRDDVLARAAIDPNANVWLSDARSIERRVEAIPYVLTARIHRGLPATLTIAIAERVAIACVRDARGQLLTIDATLRVLETGCANAPGLTFLSRAALDARPGVVLTDPAIVTLQRDAQALTAPAPAAQAGSPAQLQFVSFALDEYGQLDATLDSGVRVRFGDQDALADKERLVQPILASLGPRAGAVRAVDLRAPATPVVEFR